MLVEQHITQRFSPHAKTVMPTLSKSGNDIQSLCPNGRLVFAARKLALSFQLNLSHQVFRRGLCKTLQQFTARGRFPLWGSFRATWERRDKRKMPIVEITIGRMSATMSH